MSIDPLHHPPAGLPTPHAPLASSTPHAPEPHPPAPPAPTEQQQFQRTRGRDGFETPAHGPQLHLTPESAELRQTAQGPRGQVTTRSLSTHGQQLTASSQTQTPNGVRQETVATLEAERARLSATRTDAAGGSQRVQAEVKGDGSTSLSGEVSRPGPGGYTARGNASLTPEGGTASGQVTRNGVTARGSASVDANGYSASGGVTLSPSRGNSLQFDATASRSTRTAHDQGMTTVTTQGEVSLRVGAEAQVRGTGLTGSDATRSQTTFQVRMRDEDYARVQGGQAAQPNPYDPATLPQGSSVLMQGTDSRNTSVGASYQGVSAQQGTASQRTQSLLVERTGPNTVRLTSGPESSLENNFRVGFSAGQVSGSVTLSDSQRRAGQSHADFDLSSPAGRAAYDQALATRQLPQANGPGVSGVESQDRIQLNQGVQGQVSAGGFNFSAGITNEQELTTATRPDGSQERTARLNNNASIPVSMQRTFRPDGSEDESQRRLSLNIPHADAITAGMLHSAFTGDTNAANRMMHGPARDVQLTLTQDQMQQFQGRLREHLAANPLRGEPSPSRVLIQQLADAHTPQQLVMALGVSASPAALAEALAVAGGDSRLPGRFTVSGNQP